MYNPFDLFDIHEQYGKKIAALVEKLEEKDAEIQRLARIAENAGRSKFRYDPNTRMVDLQLRITEECLMDARDPEEVFHIAITTMLDELRHWVNKQKPKHPATIFADALANQQKHPQTPYYAETD